MSHDGQTYRVTAVPVLSRGERLAYGALTGVAFVTLVVLTTYWLNLPDRYTAFGPYALATCIMAYQVTAWVLRWLALPRMRRPSPVPPPPAGARVAAVTTFVPGAESLQMLALTLQAMVDMDVPHDSWVLDEGDDPDVRALCNRVGAHHFSRRGRSELRTESGAYAVATKHGNYNAWLTAVGEECCDILVSFDPDHVPERQYLARVLGYFADPEVAYVQVPQVYYNQEVSWIARGAAEETYDYYSAHQMASFGFGHPIVIGSHTVQRVAALREVGGFAAHDADDLLITLLYRGAGWRGVYVPEVLAVGLTPTSWPDYMRQQLRWTRSVLDIKLRALPGVASRLSGLDRLLGALHGIFYLRALTIPLGIVLLAWLLITPTKPALVSPTSLMMVGGLAAALSMIGSFRQRFYLDPKRERGFRWRAMVLQAAKWPSQVGAIWQAITGKRFAYAITAKIGFEGKRKPALWPHVAAAAMLVGAWGIGAVRDPSPSSVLTVLAAVAAISSGLLAWCATWRYRPAFDPSYYERYRATRDAAPSPRARSLPAADAVETAAPGGP